MKKLIFFLMFLCVYAGCAFANGIDNDDDSGTRILLAAETPHDPNDGQHRSAVSSPYAMLYGEQLQIRFPQETESVIVISDIITNVMYYSAPYGATRQVIVDLSTLPEGTYEIRLYAFGKWWWGEFELEE